MIHTVSAPPIVAYVLWRKWRHNEDFQQAVGTVAGALEKIQRLKEMYEQEEV